jgi:hypothetical protein
LGTFSMISAPRRDAHENGLDDAAVDILA